MLCHLLLPCYPGTLPRLFPLVGLFFFTSSRGLLSFNCERAHDPLLSVSQSFDVSPLPPNSSILTDHWRSDAMIPFSFGQREFQIRCRKPAMPYIHGLRAGEAGPARGLPWGLSACCRESVSQQRHQAAEILEALEQHFLVLPMSWHGDTHALPL